MKKCLASLVLFCFSISYSQTELDIDALTVEMCNTLSENKFAPDSLRIAFTYEKHLPSFFEKHNIVTDEQFNAVFDRIYFRMQKNCNLFVEILTRNEINKSDWEILQKAPKTIINKKECQKLVLIKHFYYFEGNGNKVHVIINKNKWTETFEDGTNSILNFKWTNDCEFELEFVESTNNSRKNLSFKGDIYHYVIYDNNNNDLKFYVTTKTEIVQSSWLHAE